MKLNIKNNLYYWLLLSAIFIFIAKAQQPKGQRIAALSPHSVEILFALGVGDRIVATLEYADFPAAAKKIPRVGNFAGVQIEKLLALKPDLVVAWESGNKRSDLEKMAALGLNLFYSQPVNINSVIEEIKALAKLTDTVQQGQKLTKHMERQYQAIKNKYHSKKKVKVFYQLWHQPLRSIGGDNWINSMIADCGGRNIFENSKAPYPVVSFESVLSRMPEVIIIPDSSAALKRKRALWVAWPEIEAVKNNHIFAINGDRLQRFTPRAIEGLRRLCRSVDQAREKN